MRFFRDSGLQANPEKSSFYFAGITNGEEELICQRFGIPKGKLQLTYLGVPLYSKKLNASQWQIR